MTNPKRANIYERAANDADLPCTSGYFYIDTTQERQNARKQKAALLSLAWATRTLERQLDRLEREGLPR
jgi:hypothetical protein